MAKIKRSRYDLMINERMTKLMIIIGIPSIISMVVTSLYYMTDTFFVRTMCFILIIFTLPLIIGVYGVSECQPVADTLTFLISIPFAVYIIKEINGLIKAMIPGDDLPVPEVSVDDFNTMTE